MKLTASQQLVLGELRAIGRTNAMRWKGDNDHLHKGDLERIAGGDQSCAFCLGGLTWQVGNRIGMKASAVLAIFKALEKKGLVIREQSRWTYQRPLYWWPVGLAAELHAELASTAHQQQEGE